MLLYIVYDGIFLLYVYSKMCNVLSQDQRFVKKQTYIFLISNLYIFKTTSLV